MIKINILGEKRKKCFGECGRILPATDEYFHFRNDSKKFKNVCQECSNKKSRKYYNNNREVLTLQKREKYKVDSTKMKLASKVYREKNREYYKILSKKYRKENREKCLETQKEYYYKNREERIEKQKPITKKNKRNKRKNDSSFKLRENISRAIKQILFLTGGSKRNKTILDFLPYTPQQLKEHLEGLFEPWMNWDNYGKISTIPKTTWQIDHIIPQSKLLFDSLEHPNFLKCWALENLRPYDSWLNVRKGNKI